MADRAVKFGAVAVVKCPRECACAEQYASVQTPPPSFALKMATVCFHEAFLSCFRSARLLSLRDRNKQQFLQQ